VDAGRRAALNARRVRILADAIPIGCVAQLDATVVQCLSEAWARTGLREREMLEMVGESDAAVINASLDEPWRFGQLFDRHATVVFRYLVRRVGIDAAEGLLGDVFRVGFEKRGTYDCDRPNARPWLYGIATNLIAHHWRSEARRIHATARLLTRHPPSDDPTEHVAARVDAIELWPRVAEALTHLADEERDALLLYAWEELRYDEIAMALGVPIGTVRSRINRARQRLRERPTSIGRQG